MALFFYVKEKQPDYNKSQVNLIYEITPNFDLKQPAFGKYMEVMLMLFPPKSEEPQRASKNQVGYWLAKPLAGKMVLESTESIARKKVINLTS